MPLGASLVHAGPARGPAADYRGATILTAPWRQYARADLSAASRWCRLNDCRACTFLTPAEAAEALEARSLIVTDDIDREHQIARSLGSDPINFIRTSWEDGARDAHWAACSLRLRPGSATAMGHAALVPRVTRSRFAAGTGSLI